MYVIEECFQKNSSGHLYNSGRLDNNNELKDLASQLIARGVDLGKTNNDGETALMVAIQCISKNLGMYGEDDSYLEIIKLILDKDAHLNINKFIDIDAQDSINGRSALMISVENDLYDLTSDLITYGAKIGLQDNHGLTAGMLSLTKNIFIEKPTLKDFDRINWSSNSFEEIKFTDEQKKHLNRLADFKDPDVSF